jgi:hypothetical protein
MEPSFIVAQTWSTPTPIPTSAATFLGNLATPDTEVFMTNAVQGWNMANSVGIITPIQIFILLIIVVGGVFLIMNEIDII